MNTRFLALALLAPLVGTLALSSDAHACGGCVVPPETNTVVNAHRMALAISPTQTVLWDQIRYKGDPASWGWLLPVKPGAVIELSTDAWFETLDAGTTTNVSPPPLSCGGGSGFGCGSSDAAPTAGGDFGGNGGVLVVHRGTVGPFSTVTLSTKTPGALDDWLAEAGFNIPADSAPVIDAYVKEGFDFIALKLQPDKNIDEMKPVRVVQQGSNPTLPLRMVSVGSGANVAITLYIIGEGRWEAENFTNTLVPVDLLAWDFAASSSNYTELREGTIKQNGGNVWLTTFARKQALMAPIGRAFNVNNDFNFTSIMGDAYVRQGVRNGETADAACASAFNQFAQSGRLVVDPCPPGVPSYSSECGMVAADETDARLFECGALDEVLETTLDDMATALTGMHPKDVWVTRLEADLPRSGLAKDLIIKPSTNQKEVSADLQARLGKNACGSSVVAPISTTPSNDDKGRMLVLLTMTAAGLLAFARKRLGHRDLPSLT
ncbi:MAG TPA: DUF2330 domain-containing protein [Polyangium sp.]|nr:DUF2330 domain-containing protein [Polyangium sp.]